MARCCSHIVKYQLQNLWGNLRQRAHIGIVVWLFGALCLAFGFLSIGGIVTGFYEYWRTRGEVTTQAQLLSVESRTTGSVGRGPGSTYTVVRYEYQVGGQTFNGDRIAMFKQTRDFYEPLSSALHSGTPIRVFIDPQHPNFSVIDREFAWWPIIVLVPFSLTFATIGLLIVVQPLLRKFSTPSYIRGNELIRRR